MLIRSNSPIGVPRKSIQDLEDSAVMFSASAMCITAVLSSSQCALHLSTHSMCGSVLQSLCTSPRSTKDICGALLQPVRITFQGTKSSGDVFQSQSASPMHMKHLRCTLWNQCAILMSSESSGAEFLCQFQPLMHAKNYPRSPVFRPL